MKKINKKFLSLTFVMVLMITFVFGVTAYGQNADGDSFDQMLDQLRQEFFSPIRPARDNELRQVFVDDSNIFREPQEAYIPELDYNEYIGIVPFSQVYVEGSRRDFRAQVTIGSTAVSTVEGVLVKQGEHVNIWVLCPDDYRRAMGASYADVAHQDVLQEFMDNEELLTELIGNFDDIYRNMTQSFAPFEGVVVRTIFNNIPLGVGDVHQDGRINVLLYNLRGRTSGNSGTLGFFSSGDFFNNGGNEPIALFHMDLARTFGYDIVTGTESQQLTFYDLFAHEFQHMLFYMYVGVYGIQSDQFLWFNEALSEFAGAFNARAGIEVISNSRNFAAAENGYFPGSRGYGDFLNFSNSMKNYSMGRLHATLMSRKISGSTPYSRLIYEFFMETLPPATDATTFNANRNHLTEMGAVRFLGNAFAHAGLTGTTGAVDDVAFNLLYFLFMENFAADGGNVITQSGEHPTRNIFDSPYSAYNLWGLRPNLGIERTLNTIGGSWGHNGVFQDSIVGVFNLGPRREFTTLLSGDTITLVGYNGNPPQIGASHERFYRIAGESIDNSILRISIEDNHPYTLYYVAIPNEPIDSVSHSNNRRFGQDGATLHLLQRNGEENFIDTEGKVAYLFIVTLFRNVENVMVTYSWGSEMPAIGGEKNIVSITQLDEVRLSDIREKNENVRISIVTENVPDGRYVVALFSSSITSPMIVLPGVITINDNEGIWNLAYLDFFIERLEYRGVPIVGAHDFTFRIGSSVEVATNDEPSAAFTLVISPDETTIAPCREALRLVIADAEGINQGDNTAISWARLQNVLRDARNVYNRLEATQVEIDNATNNLRVAMEAIVGLSPQPDPVDRAALITAIEEAEVRVQTMYTPISWARLQSVLRDARNIRDNANATQNQIDVATNALNIALSGLVPR
ncbi:MAG: FIVAR domain-containing protein [Defluviitaleaceae bacterium]|nr:FIVAR domain-containing protein [Defluviitaleaceae bacterium]